MGQIKETVPVPLYTDRKSLIQKSMSKVIIVIIGIPEKWYPGSGTSTGGTPEPGTRAPKCIGGTRDSEPPK